MKIPDRIIFEKIPIYLEKSHYYSKDFDVFLCKAKDDDPDKVKYINEDIVVETVGKYLFDYFGKETDLQKELISELEDK